MSLMDARSASGRATVRLSQPAKSQLDFPSRTASRASAGGARARNAVAVATVNRITLGLTGSFDLVHKVRLGFAWRGDQGPHWPLPYHGLDLLQAASSLLESLEQRAGEASARLTDLRYLCGERDFKVLEES